MLNTYYSIIALLSAVVHLTINHRYFFKKDDRKEVKDYKAFLIAITFYFSSDIAWGFLHESGHLQLLYIDTIIYYISMAFSVVFCCKYVISFLHLNDRFAKVLNTFGMLFAFAEIVALIINNYYHIFFWFDDDGTYIAYYGRNIALFTLFVMYGGISIASITLSKKKKIEPRNLTICLCALCMTIALAVQWIFPLLPMYSVGLMISTVVNNVFIHNEEKTLQLKKIAELNEEMSKEQKTLKQQKSELSAAMAVINGLTNDYHTIWVVDKKDFKLQMMRMPGDGTIPEALQLAFKYADCDEAMHKYIDRFVCEEDQERMRRKINTKAIVERLSKDDFFAVNYMRRKDNGEIDYNQMAFANVKTGTSKDKFVFGFRSINDVLRQEQELRKERKLREKINEDKIAAENANESKTRFLQNMSHEIRTPLNAMFGFSQLLGMPDGSCTEEEKEQYNRYIYNSYRMLDMLISDIIDIADSEHGNYRIELSEVNLNNVCNSALMSVEFRVPANVKLYMTSDFPDDFVITSDERRIQQVLINYLTNACKNTQQGEIHLHCSKTETPGRITLSVTDTGRGVPKEKANEIFNRFTKLNQHIQGSGLGLSICQTIANKLNGEVYLDTTYTNGARFVFVI